MHTCVLIWQAFFRENVLNCYKRHWTAAIAASKSFWAETLVLKSYFQLCIRCYSIQNVVWYSSSMNECSSELDLHKSFNHNFKWRKFKQQNIFHFLHQSLNFKELDAHFLEILLSFFAFRCCSLAQNRHEKKKSCFQNSVCQKILRDDTFLKSSYLHFSLCTMH